MNSKLSKLMDKCKGEEFLEQLSLKIRIPIYLIDNDGNVASFGLEAEEQEKKVFGTLLQGGAPHCPNVPVYFMEEIIGFLTSTADEGISRAALIAAAHNLETMFKYETEIEDMSSEIVHVYDELSTIYSLSSKLGSAMDIDEISLRAIEECRNVLHAETVFVMLLDINTGMFVKQCCIGRCASGGKVFSLETSSAIVGEAFARKNSSVIDKPEPDSGLPLIYPSQDVLCIPLVTDNMTIGIMLASDKPAGDEFHSQEIKLMDAISSEIAAAIKKAQLYEQINRLFINTVEALASAIDAKDPYTYGHSKRVAGYSNMICRKLELTKKESKTIELASLLHDIGKIGTPEIILRKPYHLMQDELDKVKEHPVLGAQILGAINELKDVIDGIRHHHERFDGNGYPDQLKSVEIPFQARIIAVADCFDAMTSDRPYRKSIDPEKAIAIMEDCSGSQFDPDIFAAFKTAFSTSEFKAICESVPGIKG